MKAAFPPLPRRWYQFSLRTMFVVVIVVSIPLAWVGYSLNWIRLRHEALKQPDVIDADILLSWRPATAVKAPWCLRLFGEKGHIEVLVSTDSRLSEADLKRLFPEAKIRSYDPLLN